MQKSGNMCCWQPCSCPSKNLAQELLRLTQSNLDLSQWWIITTPVDKRAISLSGFAFSLVNHHNLKFTVVHPGTNAFGHSGSSESFDYIYININKYAYAIFIHLSRLSVYLSILSCPVCMILGLQADLWWLQTCLSNAGKVWAWPFFCRWVLHCMLVASLANADTDESIYRW